MGMGIGEVSGEALVSLFVRGRRRMDFTLLAYACEAIQLSFLS